MSDETFRDPKVEAGNRAKEILAATALRLRDLEALSGVNERTILRFFKGNSAQSAVTRIALAHALGIDVSEIDCSCMSVWKPLNEITSNAAKHAYERRCDELVERISSHVKLVQSYWLATEFVIRRTFDNLQQMHNDLQAVKLLLPQLTKPQVRDVGILAANLPGCYWSFSGPRAMPRFCRELAYQCISKLDCYDTASISEIQSALFFNSPGMEFWSRPGDRISPNAFALADRNFAGAAFCYEQIRETDPIAFGPTGDATLEQMMHRAQMCIQAGELKLAARLIKDVEDRCNDASPATLAHLYRMKAWLAKSLRQSKSGQIDQLRQAVLHYEIAFDKEPHYLIAATRMLIRDLGTKEASTFEQDVDTLSSSKVQHMDIVCMQEMRHKYAAAFAKHRLKCL
ncbi:hypothetical protein ETAA8_45950 [Anatilimnocola aggregata]|uniref:HTH cro/C1-type domain-containing protein n=1 Tax=Anatilimnocola aggregata TaxID=2528021 RepID=A0A517YGX0_9BACT|nr:helix-turn-helix transcriptional regulator [Anatilimnocola aggregata]QDU29485.1 hypothetical protein ETAA8_45950 [Anatilimnocola aggregata]